MVLLTEKMKIRRERKEGQALGRLLESLLGGFAIASKHELARKVSARWELD